MPPALRQRLLNEGRLGALACVATQTDVLVGVGLVLCLASSLAHLLNNNNKCEAACAQNPLHKSKNSVCTQEGKMHVHAYIYARVCVFECTCLDNTANFAQFTQYCSSPCSVPFTGAV